MALNGPGRGRELGEVTFPLNLERQGGVKEITQT